MKDELNLLAGKTQKQVQFLEVFFYKKNYIVFMQLEGGMRSVV